MDLASLTDRELLIHILGKVEELTGNGQPGKISMMESRIDSLESTRDEDRGARWVFRGLWSAVIVAAEYFYHHK